MKEIKEEFMTLEEENAELVYSWLRTHPDSALRWIDTNRDHQSKPSHPEIEPGDPAYGFWEIYSPTNYTTYEDKYPILGDELSDLGSELRHREYRA